MSPANTAPALRRAATVETCGWIDGDPGDANLNGFSLFLCASNTRTETIRRFTTTSSIQNLPTLGSISFTAASTSALASVPASTSTSSSEHHPDTAAHFSSGTSVGDKSGSAESLSFTTTKVAGNEVTSQDTHAPISSTSTTPATASLVSPTSIVGAALGGIGM
ncbi:hypothetical protein E4U39_005559 [Claviceps sp. Clav50 group G5]|nr:hypothetical protein E4U39_005559 [Claviceps sp. Clav50 group G5]